MKELDIPVYHRTECRSLGFRKWVFRKKELSILAYHTKVFRKKELSSLETDRSNLLACCSLGWGKNSCQVCNNLGSGSRSFLESNRKETDRNSLLVYHRFPLTVSDNSSQTVWGMKGYHKMVLGKLACRKSHLMVSGNNSRLGCSRLECYMLAECNRSAWCIGKACNKSVMYRYFQLVACNKSALYKLVALYIAVEWGSFPACSNLETCRQLEECNTMVLCSYYLQVECSKSVLYRLAECSKQAWCKSHRYKGCNRKV